MSKEYKLLTGKEGSKREQGTFFCFNFCVRYGDHRALHHITDGIMKGILFLGQGKVW